jgi:hypothetical protein
MPWNRPDNGFPGDRLPPSKRQTVLTKKALSAMSS